MKIKFIHFIFLALLLRLVFAFIVYHPDVRNHVDWGIRFFDYGPNRFFAPEANVWSYTWPNQPPGSILMFAGIYQIFLFIFGLLTWLNQNVPTFPSNVMFFLEDALYPALLQLPAIIADFGIAYLIYKVLKENTDSNKARLGAFVFLANPAVWYNSAVWGQYDAVINYFGLLAFYLLYRQKLTLAFLAFALSIYIKLSLAIFAPVFLLVLFKQKVSFIKFIKATLVTAAIFGIVTFIFSTPQDPYTWLYNLYTKRILVQQLHVITANAFNLWAAIAGIHERPDNLLLGPFSYQYLGYVLYIPVYLFSLLRIWRGKGEINTYTWVAVIAFASFMLLTNMHERYLYPLFPYFTIITLLNLRLLWLYVAVSAISLLNLYNFWFTPRIEPLVKAMEAGDRLLPRILGAINFYLFVVFIKYVVQFTLRKQE